MDFHCGQGNFLGDFDDAMECVHQEKGVEAPPLNRFIHRELSQQRSRQGMARELVEQFVGRVVEADGRCGERVVAQYAFVAGRDGHESASHVLPPVLSGALPQAIIQMWVAALEFAAVVLARQGLHPPAHEARCLRQDFAALRNT